jgi:hypothetical protein
MSLSNLANWRGHPPRTNPPLDRVRAAAVPAPAPAAPAPAAPQPRASFRDLTVDDAHALSIEAINLLVKEDPAFVGRLIVDAGRRRRAELPMNTSALRPIARFILLAGERRRGRELNEEESDFMAAFNESIGA